MEAQVEKSRLGRLLDPVFVVALAVLLLNDHVWKAEFHNFWTGKLSDFAGLYAFAWVGMSLLPRMKQQVPWLAAAAFICWKSPLVEPLLSGWNATDIWPLARVLDYGDWWAVAVLPLANRRFAGLRGNAGLWAKAGLWANAGRVRMLRAALQGLVLGVALFAFCATSEKNDFVYDVEYELPISHTEAVRRLNQLNSDLALHNPVLSTHHCNANQFIQEGQHRLYLHHNLDTETFCDTLYAQIKDSVFIDEIREYEIPSVDSIYVNPDGVFRFYFPLSQRLESDTSTHQCFSVLAICSLKAVGNGSRLKLLHSDSMNCEILPPEEKKDNAETYLRKKFEENVVAVLKKQ